MWWSVAWARPISSSKSMKYSIPVLGSRARGSMDRGLSTLYYTRVTRITNGTENAAIVGPECLLPSFFFCCFFFFFAYSFVKVHIPNVELSAMGRSMPPNLMWHAACCEDDEWQMHKPKSWGHSTCHMPHNYNTYRVRRSLSDTSKICEWLLRSWRCIGFYTQYSCKGYGVVMMMTPKDGRPLAYLGTVR